MKRFITTHTLVLYCCLISLAAHGQQKVISEKSNPLRITFSPSIATVNWLKPARPYSRVKEPEYEVKVEAIGEAKPVNINLLLNNREVKDEQPENRGFKPSAGNTRQPASSKKYLYQWNVSLEAGLNDLRVRWKSKESESEISTIVVYEPEADTRNVAGINNRNDYALLFATNEYDKWNDLVNPIADAQAIAEELKQSYGFRVELITNPDDRQIIEKIREYTSRSFNDNDQLFVFFAGHGDYDETLNQGYLVCRNSELNDFSRRSYISHNDLRSYVNNIPANHILLTMDVCFGGTIDQKIASRGRSSPVYEEIDADQFIEEKMRYKTRLYLTSGGKEYVSDGIPGQHSPFTRKFLEALRKEKVNGILTLNRLYSYMERVKPTPRVGEFQSNVPGSDFLFISSDYISKK